MRRRSKGGTGSTTEERGRGARDVKILFDVSSQSPRATISPSFSSRSFRLGSDRRGRSGEVEMRIPVASCVALAALSASATWYSRYEHSMQLVARVVGATDHGLLPLNGTLRAWSEGELRGETGASLREPIHGHHVHAMLVYGKEGDSICFDFLEEEKEEEADHRLLKIDAHVAFEADADAGTMAHPMLMVVEEKAREAGDPGSGAKRSPEKRSVALAKRTSLLSPLSRKHK